MEKSLEIVSRLVHSDPEKWLHWAGAGHGLAMRRLSE
jgi:hypothetical protein